MKSVRSSRLLGCGALALLSAMAVAPAADAAPNVVEGAQNAPDPLQYPAITPSNGGAVTLPVTMLRQAIEAAGNAQLCKVLMTDAHMAIPDNFDFSKCPTDIANKVKNRQGKARWASGAKPTECGTNCVGRPSNGRDMNVDRPNTHHATVTGHIDIEVDNPGPNRTVYFNWKAFARCDMKPGGPPHQGEIKFDVVVDPPVVGDAGFWEGAINFFLGPVDWSRRIGEGIRAQLSTPGGQTSNTGLKCMTVGSVVGGNAAQDAFVFDVKPPVIVGPPRTATVRLISVTRKPVPTFNYTPPVDPGSFVLFVNGVSAPLPTTAPLPPGGGTAPLNMCKTINMDGSDRLQVLFTSSLGGTTWSQLGSADGYGAGKTHRMTTGRNVVVPGRPSPINPHPKPETLHLDEFELTYTIEYSNPLGGLNSLPAAQLQAAGGPSGPSPTPATGIVKGNANLGAVKGLDQKITPQPCRQL